MEWRYSKDGSKIELINGEPIRKLKMTGTRLAGVLGLNPWSTPFQMWCEITKSAKPPFEDTKYTLAGKAIEPKQIQWTKKQIDNMVLSPEEFFGNRYKEVRYDFYPDSRIFGGMWDAKRINSLGKTTDIFEYKTTKRAEDWVKHPPVYYLVQVLEYAYLEGCNRVHLVVSFLEDDDYNHPENYAVSDDNTQIFTYKVDSTYINLDDGNITTYRDGVNSFTIFELIDIAHGWYNNHIKTGISPEFDEKKDKEYLDILRTATPQNDMGGSDLVARANHLIREIESIKERTSLNLLEKELKACEKGIKDDLSQMMGLNDTKAVLGNYTLSKTTKESITLDEDRMKADGIYEKYAIYETKETLTLRKKKEEN